jgi:hypothetical protein
MSIDERLRTGLARNTEHLLVDPRTELEATYSRARRRQLTRRGAVAVAAVAAAAVTAWVVTLPDPDEDPQPVAPTPAPTDLVGVEGPLEPGLYALAAWGEKKQTGPLPRTILDVPEGYFSNGGYALDAGHDGVTDDQPGEISVWHAVQVLTDPCRGGTATDVGPTAEDLAEALARADGPSSQPRPVVLDGHRGLSLEVTVPPDTDLTRCTGNHHTLWRTEPRGDSAYNVTVPGVTSHLWILDVDGTRLVLVATLHPDQTDELHHEQLSIAESARFEAGS